MQIDAPQPWPIDAVRRQFLAEGNDHHHIAIRKIERIDVVRSNQRQVMFEGIPADWRRSRLAATPGRAIGLTDHLHNRVPVLNQPGQRIEPKLAAPSENDAQAGWIR